MLMNKKKRAIEVFNRLTQKYPDVGTFLVHKNPFELLIAVILSAQCTDERVNKTTPLLFQQFPTPKALYEAPLDDVRNSIKSINFFNNKAINIQKTAGIIYRTHNNMIPDRLADLIQLPGVGRKTANVVLNMWWQHPAQAVDTHIFRVGNRTGLAKGKTPEQVEAKLEKRVPQPFRLGAHHWLILHGRYVCKARTPECWRCPVVDLCSYRKKVLERPKGR